MNKKNQRQVKPEKKAGSEGSTVKRQLTRDEMQSLSRDGSGITKFRRRALAREALKLKIAEKKKMRQKRKKEEERLGDKAPPKKVPHTIESLRVHDETFVDAKDIETDASFQVDEFENYFQRSYEPKVLITSSANPHLKTRLFMREMSRLVPNSEVLHRRQAKVKHIIEQAKLHDYTDIIIVNEDAKIPRSMLITHLPTGPTAFFRLSNVQITKDIKRKWTEITSHRPEVIVNNFNTRLGVIIGRMLSCLFHHDPQFKGRRVVTFHNQRDYIFIRHHRYEFKDDGKRAALRELGPRFTLKLRSLQHGTFDSKTGEYEYIVTNKRHELESNRRRFYL